jgi:hypothetical protein
MAVLSELQKQYVFDPRASVRVFSAMVRFYQLVCDNPPVVDLAQVTGLSNGDNHFGPSDWKVGKSLKKTASGQEALFAGFDFALGKNFEYEDYIFGVSICRKHLKANYQDGARNGSFDVLERNDDWITVKLEQTSFTSPQALSDAVSNIVKSFLQ